jgi:hypothetical protein
VRRWHRNQAIGGRLLRAAEDWGCSLAAEFASLECQAANTREGRFCRERMAYRVAAMIIIKRLER